MKNIKKGFVTPMVIVVMAILIIGGIYTTTKNKSATDADGWKTYENSQYSFNYPSEWGEPKTLLDGELMFDGQLGIRTSNLQDIPRGIENTQASVIIVDGRESLYKWGPHDGTILKIPTQGTNAVEISYSGKPEDPAFQEIARTFKFRN